MGRRKDGQPPPVILLISPTQFATKFMTQEDKPQIAARLKIRKVGEHGGFEVPLTIQNPEYKPEKAMQGDGKKKHHLFGKKARKIIRGATRVAEIAAPIAEVTPGLEEFAPGLAAAAAAGEVAGRGPEQPPKKSKKKPRYTLM